MERRHGEHRANADFILLFLRDLSAASVRSVSRNKISFVMKTFLAE
ncbi:MAG: hypothetical protein JWQ62_2933, partial [Lacunisphaera sp.]|nr:hypothetical protein [Lacunisphaera sp.]